MAQSGGKISYAEVLVHVDSTFSRLFDMKTLLPLLVAKRVVPRNFQDRYPESRRASILLGVLKRKPTNFFEFLRALLQHASQGEEKSQRLVCIMSTHLKNMSTYEEECPGSDSVVLSFLAASEAYKSTQESSSPTLTQKQVTGIVSGPQTHTHGRKCLGNRLVPKSACMPECWHTQLFDFCAN